MDTSILVRIFDTDTVKLEETESALRKSLKAYGVQDFEIQPISCFLEIQRHNKIDYVPVLEVNGLTISVRKPITRAMLEDCSARLARWQVLNNGDVNAPGT
ncbi:hypothetical protein [Desulfomonile tiedjei]|uniref:Uncharacterized protein n=1 Tax=Desulfomonile tiedjei (strain ATCC 49306 / DSM 6799 / DCB-1) TaxID=706587 RepID=I4C5J0_DESTA|nr:hypothetical protein [Desulfomonile tiedjei]AFM24831.1 hypothetical protein Desti_2133 [Desulfomonile tiedjei DSM 6799]